MSEKDFRSAVTDLRLAMLSDEYVMRSDDLALLWSDKRIAELEADNKSVTDNYNRLMGEHFHRGNVIEQQAAGIAALRADHNKVVENAVQLIGQACDKHSQAIKRMPFSEFHAIVNGRCQFCDIAEIAALREQLALLDKGYEISRNDDPEDDDLIVVHRRRGNRNDREWVLVTKGRTASEALAKALKRIDPPAAGEEKV